MESALLSCNVYWGSAESHILKCVLLGKFENKEGQISEESSRDSRTFADRSTGGVKVRRHWRSCTRFHQLLTLAGLCLLCQCFTLSGGQWCSTLEGEVRETGAKITSSPDPPPAATDVLFTGDCCVLCPPPTSSLASSHPPWGFSQLWFYFQLPIPSCFCCFSGLI